MCGFESRFAFAERRLFSRFSFPSLQVSYVRQRDLHILTVGRYTYTSDQRFTCIHLDDSDDWTLEIKYVQKDDAGVYECAVRCDSLFVGSQQRTLLTDH